MSRVGNRPITIPAGVSVTIADSKVHVKGPKGELEVNILPGISVAQNDDNLSVSRVKETRQSRSYHGLVRTLLENALTGVTEGFSKQLEINGVGYRAQVQGNKLVLSLGLSHDIEYKVPETINLTVEGNIITVSGYDKELVGRVSSQIKSFKPPEPYKGKGIKFVGERIRRKAGKAAAATTGAK